MGFFKSIKKIIKQATPVLAAVAGTALGGPAGGIIGGALGGASTRGHDNKLKGAVTGAGIGSAYAALAPVAHAALAGPAATSQGLLSSATGINQPSLLAQLGMKSAPQLGGGIGLFGNLGQKGAIPALFGSVSGKAAAGKGLLAGTGLLGMAKKAIPVVQKGLSQSVGKSGDIGGGVGYGPEPISMSSQRLGSFGGSDFYPGQPITGPSGRELDASEKKNVAKILNNPNLSSMEKLMLLSQYLGVEEGDYTGKEVGDTTEPVTFKRGGLVTFKKGGYIKGKSGGQADDKKAKLRPDDYILDATTLSLYGDGNSEAGAERFKKEVESRYSNIHRMNTPEPSVKYIDALVSPGEYRVKREVVSAIGKGDAKKGADILDSFRKNLRSHKGVTKFLPPKSKPFDHYAFKGGAVH